MLLQYKDTFYETKNELSEINLVFEKINRDLNENNMVYSHLIIDGVEVFSDQNKYIMDHLQSIEKIEIIAKTMIEIVMSSMESIHDYLEGAVPALRTLIEESYDDFSKKSWDGINYLAEGMQVILQFMESTISLEKKPNNWEGVERSLAQCKTNFIQLLEAVEAQDTILIPDILSYEILPAYESLLENIAVALNDKE